MTETAIETVSRPTGGKLSRKQIDLLKRTVCRGATDDELALFVAQTERTGLDPFARQIHAVKRYDSNLSLEVMAIQVGIDGFRLIAQRTGQYAGQTPAEWCGEDGAWRDVWLSSKPPAAARVGVLRAGFEAPLYRVARYTSYVQTKKDGSPTRFWVTMPDVMLSKCAEALALRTAFPQELSGLYTVEEMGQTENEAPQQGPAVTMPQARKEASPAPPAPKSPDAAIIDAEVVPSNHKEPVRILTLEERPNSKGEVWCKASFSDGTYGSTKSVDLIDELKAAQKFEDLLIPELRPGGKGNVVFLNGITVQRDEEEVAP